MVWGVCFLLWGEPGRLGAGGQYDLEVAEDTIAARIRREVKPAPRDLETGDLKADLRG
jgi:hypothetical protein